MVARYHKNHIQVNDELGFDYHGLHRHGIVLEENWPRYFKVELESGEIKNFRYDRLDNELVTVYNEKHWQST